MPGSNTPTTRLAVAKIAAAHGVRGLVKIQSYVETIDILQGELFTSETGPETLCLSLKNATAKHWLAEIDGISDRNAAEALKGTLLYRDRAALPALEEGEFYYSDLIGLPTLDINGENIGEIIATENFGASDLLEIQPVNAASFYLPVSNDTVLEIKQNHVIISIPEGLDRLN